MTETVDLPSVHDQRRIIDELHAYSRHDMQLWVQWFIFFVTVNYAALGWFAGQMALSQIKSVRPLRYISILFITQGALGIWVSLLWRKKTLERSERLNREYLPILGSKQLPEFSALPYAASIVVGTLALGAIIGIWILMGFTQQTPSCG